MRTEGSGAPWPFPGLVWGDYPQRPLPLKRQPRRGDWNARSLERFARDAVARHFDAAGHEGVDAALLKACAALVRQQGVTPRWQQVMAARGLLEQRLVELDTGEGKTFAVALAAAAAALAGTPVHVVTANDYLAQRDAQALAGFYAGLGLRSAFVTEGMQPAERRAAYRNPVTYVTGKELAFDYLRDVMQAPSSGSALQQRLTRMESAAGGPGTAGAAGDRVLRGLCFAILDEADTLLVDEARIPMVLAQADSEPGEREFHRTAWEIASAMREGVHFRTSADGLQVRLLPPGRELLLQWPADAHVLHGHPAHRESVAVLALTASHLLLEGRDYVVREGKVALVDSNTGRLSQGRAWSRGLHQLVEIKEGLVATQRNETVLQVTYQRFFARYLRLAGTSGTLREAKSELARVYGLSMLRVPSHEPRRVTDHGTRLFADSAALWQAVATRAAELRAQGRPVLVGVNSVNHSTALSATLREQGVHHELLDATHDEHERALLAAAGRAGAVTVATSMAGRGSDILPDKVALAAGGLHVILCQLNSSARIDRQFLGRAGRQGQPGSTERWIAADQEQLGSVPTVVLRTWTANTRAGRLSLSLFLRLLQVIRTYTDMQQRVNLLRGAESEERELAFTRNQPI